MRQKIKCIIAIILFSIFLCNAVEARLPQTGDHVGIRCANGESYKGTITDILDGFLCLNAEYPYYDQDTQRQETEFTDVCIGIGSICYLAWD
jgi:hypothetical protein